MEQITDKKHTNVSVNNRSLFVLLLNVILHWVQFTSSKKMQKKLFVWIFMVSEQFVVNNFAAPGCSL